MKHPKTCVIVTSGKVARLFDLQGRGDALSLVEKQRLEAREVNSPADTQGVTHSSVGHSQHRLAPHSGPDKRKDAFAADIADRLASDTGWNAFERLVVIASPKMMGLLRARLDAKTQAKVWTQIDKNLAQMPVEKIGDVLNEVLYP